MTTPDERTRSVIQMEKMIHELAPHLKGKGVTAKVPRELIRSLYRGLRHYPTAFELSEVSRLAPQWFGDPE